MISTQNVSLQFSSRTLFDDVSITFSPGNCYGIIGANGSGKSTFMKILSGELEPTAGSIAIGPNQRLSFLKQDQFAYDELTPLETVIRGHDKLFAVMKEKDEIYAKPDFSDEDGVRAAELEAEFTEMDGWNAEPEAEKLLSNLDIHESLHHEKMKNLEASQKIRILLAQALFGDPDILLLDEPTNQLDVETVMWLENFLSEFKNTAIVVSHDRHFLDQVCTHIADIDYGKITTFAGNYSFWKQSSELALNQRQDKNKKIEDKRKELQDFIRRFSANAAKSKQATSRKKLLEKLTLDDIKPSSRKYPYVNFQPHREAGNDLLDIDKLSLTFEDKVMFENVNLHIQKGDKAALIGKLDLSKSMFFDTLAGENQPTSGSFKWGVSTTRAYFPKNLDPHFESELNLVDWLRQFSEDTDEGFIRGFLGRMLFSGEEALKKVNVLSGGEKVRMMLSKMMLTGANVLILDEPTNHLDLESISSLNEGLQNFKGTILFSSQDHQFVQTIANRIIEITPQGVIDQNHTTLDDYLSSEHIKERRKALYPEDVLNPNS